MQPRLPAPDVILSMIQQRTEQPSVASVSCATSLSIGTCESKIFSPPVVEKNTPRLLPSSRQPTARPKDMLVGY